MYILIRRKMSNTPEKKETENIKEFMGLTIDALQSLLDAVKYMKKDLYESTHDALDEDLEIVEDTINEMVEFI